jgi:aminopeptidase-like protein
MFESREIFLVADEGEIACGGTLQNLHIVNFDVRVSLQLRLQHVSDF